MLQADDKAKAEKIHKLQTEIATKDDQIEQLKKQLNVSVIVDSSIENNYCLMLYYRNFKS